MKHKFILVSAFVILVMFAFSACNLLPGGTTNTVPTATPPFPTSIVVATPAPGETPAAPAGETTAPTGEISALGGDIFNDSNGDGKRDENEQLIAGVVVQLAAGECPGNPLSVATSTANQPSYKFENLNTGDYCISIDAALPENAATLGQGNWTVPQQAQGTIMDSVTLRRQDKLNIDFGWTFGAIGQATTAPGEPTQVAGQPTPEPGQPTTVPPIPTPTAFVQPTAPAQACTFKAVYLEDVTIPDGQVMLPNTPFIKTWRVQNVGTCSWGPGSGLQNLQFVGGNPLGAPNLVPIPNTIPAGATGDLSIQMTAPAQPGKYTSKWKLRADDGTLIGVPQGNSPLSAVINVQAAAPPTSVPPPTTLPPPGPTQPIQMAPGATEASVQGQLPANGIATYSVNAQQGQMMELTLSSNSPTARIAVLSPTGVPLPPQRGNPEGTYWQSTLPANGNYIIQVLAGNGAPAANYGLSVTIPVRISFAPGAVSAQVQGTTSESRVVTYLLKAMGGQTMTVNLTAPPNSAGITIYGLQDGQPLVRSQSGATSWTGQLPMTQDYVIQVVPFGNGTVNYTLDVTVQ